MLNFKNMRFALIGLSALCSTVLSAQNLAPDISGKGWKLSSKNADVKFEADKTASEDGKACGKITVPDMAANGFCIYSYVQMQENKSYRISFEFKVKDFQKSETGYTEIAFSFNKKDKGNGSAGASKMSINIDASQNGWQDFSTEIQAPPETEKCQLKVFAARTIKGIVWIRDVKVEEIKDSFAINKTETAPLIDGKLDDDCWKKALPLAPFYRYDDITRPVRIPTMAFLAYDDKNFYVAFKNTEPSVDKIQSRVKERDGHVWTDDCNEIFIAAPNETVLQLIVNSINTQWDGTLSVKVPGDPYKSDSKWNGDWKSAVFKDKDSWTTEISIPFSNFQMQAWDGEKWHINLAREQIQDREISHFNRFSGTFQNVAKFAELQFSKDGAALKRYSESQLSDPLKISRKSPRFKELLIEKSGDYISFPWTSEYILAKYPRGIKEKYTPETFALEQNNILSEWGEAGLMGPTFPWASTNIIGGMKKIRELSEKYKMKFVFFMDNSSLARKAISEGAEYSYAPMNLVDAGDPVYKRISEEYCKKYFTDNKDKLPYIKIVCGKDEPTNAVARSFSMTLNEKHKDALRKVDEEIKKNLGFGKYGLYDAFATDNDPAVAPFSMIAFMRWWNNSFAESIKSRKELLREYAPETEFQAYSMNCTGGLSNEDISLLSPYTDWASVDPYPTATMYHFGLGRGLYHTGFSVKLARDLSGGKATAGIVQGFSYCGTTPSSENIREWASQTMKNGANSINWFCEGGTPTRVDLPGLYREILRLTNIMTKMNKLEIPSETKTAIFFSNPSHWGNFDKAVHSWYTVYSILGENLKTWFRFISDSGLRLKMDELSKYKAVYLPQIKYCEADTAELLLDYVKGGGKLIIFDPEAFTWNIDGTRLDKVRNELIGCPVGKALDVKNLIVSADYSGLKKGDELPLTLLAHRAEAGKVQAFEITPPAGAKVIANYPDGKSAAFERNVGKGSVIYFAAQPFGNSDLAVKDSKWSVLMKGIAEQIGEKTDLPIWDFELPAKGGEIEVKYVIKPEVK